MNDFSCFEFRVLVRDLDPQGHMANHVYVAYLSEARARYLISIDPQMQHLLPSVVADVHVKYVSSLVSGETFRVKVRAARVGRSSVTYEYRIEAGDRLVAEADSVEVSVDRTTRRPREIGPEGRRLLGHV